MPVPCVEARASVLPYLKATAIRRLTSGQSTNNPRFADGGLNDRNDVPEFGLKGREEICASPERTETVSVCELGEDSDIAAVFESETWYLMVTSTETVRRI